MPKHNNSVLILCLFILFSWKGFAQKDELKITYKKNSDRTLAYCSGFNKNFFLVKEFTKRERKKYISNPEIFK